MHLTTFAVIFQTELKKVSFLHKKFRNHIERSHKFDLNPDEEIITYIKTLKNNESNGPFSILSNRFKKFNPSDKPSNKPNIHKSDIF